MLQALLEMLMDWLTIFNRDGSLRDIYVHDTTLSDWTRFLNFLRGESKITLSFSLDGLETPIPGDVSEIFEKRERVSPLLSVDLGGIVLRCHFFSDQEIELDLDPAEIKEEAHATSVFAFLAALGKILGKKVELTAENRPDVVLYSVNHP